jgi:hypothetical protein
MKTFNKIIIISFVLFNIPLVKAKDAISFRYNKEKVTGRKSLVDAYARFGKVYRPYVSGHSNLDPKVSRQLVKIFTLTDMAVIEKVLLLEFIGKIANGDLSRSTPYTNYYQEIIEEIKAVETKDKRIIKIKKDLVKGIEFHKEVLDSWLNAARKNQVHKVKNKSGRWVHPGTSAGDKIFYSLYHKYIKKHFSQEYPENLEALNRHLCVLVF